MRISGNSEMTRALRHFGNSRNLVSDSLGRISSGLRVRSAADDAASLAVSEKMRALVGVYEMDIYNAQSGISLAQTADGGLQTTHSILRRIRDLTLLSANGTLTDADRDHMQSEVNRLLDEIDRVDNSTEYNTMGLFSGRLGSSAAEVIDRDNVLIDGSARVLLREMADAGTYDFEVLSGATFAQAAFEGRALNQGEESPDAHEAGSFHDLLGSNSNGYVTMTVKEDDKVASVTALADEDKGDSINNVVRKFNVALDEAGINAFASYQPAETGTIITTDTTGVLPEPLGTTVPLTWSNAPPLNWAAAYPKVYDAANNPVSDNTYTLDFTAANTYTVTGDLSGVFGTYNTGANVNTGGLSFNVQAGAYTAGDRVILTPGASPRSANIAASTTGAGNAQVAMDSTISDGNHTITVTNTSTVTGSNFGGVRGEPITTGTNTAGVEGDENVTGTDSTWATGALNIDSSSGNSSISATAVGWATAPTFVASGNTIVDETFTLQLTTDNGGINDVWSVTGSVSGVHNPYTDGGAAYTSNAVGGQGGGLQFNITPDANYVLGDQVQIQVSTGPAPAVTLTSSINAANTIVDETFTMELITDNFPAGDVWSVTGSVSGAKANFTVGTPYTTAGGSGGGLNLALNANANYAVGDRITIDVDNTAAPVPNFSQGPDFVDAGNTITNETFTLELITDIEGADIWTVTGSVSGSHTNYVGGNSYVSNEGTLGGGKGLRFDLDQDADYGVGDVITIGTNLSPPAMTWATAPAPSGPANTLWTETFTLELITDNGGLTDEWSVVGSVSGNHNNYTVGGLYTSNDGSSGGGEGLQFALTPDADYAVGDTITIGTQYGREAGLDTDATPNNVVPGGTYNLVDDSGNDLSITFGPTITAGADTATVSTDVNVNSTIMPDISWDTDAYIQQSNTVLVSETFTMTMTADNDGADVWSVVGSASGTHNPYTTGQDYVSNTGSNGFGRGVAFNLDTHSRYHVGSVIELNIYVARPTIIIESREAGSATEYVAEVKRDDTASAITAHGSEELVVGVAHSEVDTDTVIHDNDGNPYNDLALGTGSFTVRTHDGQSYTITVNNNDTIQDLLDSLNAIGTVTASFSYSSKKISINDNSSGPNTLKVEDPDGSYMAERLGIRQETEDSSITGYEVTRTRDHIVEITDEDDYSVIVHGKAGSKTNTFEAYRRVSSDDSIVGSSRTITGGGGNTGNGGLTGVEFALEQTHINDGSTFSIALEQGRLVMKTSPDSGSVGTHELNLSSVSSIALGLRDIGGSFNMATISDAQKRINEGTIDAAIDYVSKLRGKIGAFQRGLEETLHVNRLQRENLQSSESRIRDADMSSESTRFAQGNIMLQAGQVAMTHLNTIRNSVLSLLQ